MFQQNTELAKVKARIRALSERTVDNGCTEHEALLAAEKIGALLSVYNLTMSEIDLRDEPCVTVKVSLNAIKYTVAGRVCSSIAKLCDCINWVTREVRNGKATKVMCFFGMESDAAMAAYLFSVIDAASRSEAAKFKKTDLYRQSKKKTSATTSFGHGMVDRLNTRLKDLKYTQDRDTAAHRAEQQKAIVAVYEAKKAAGENPEPISSGQSLVVLKAKIVAEAFKKSGVKLRSGGTFQTRLKDRASFAAGSAAASRVNLSRPIEQTGGVKLLTR